MTRLRTVRVPTMPIERREEMTEWSRIDEVNRHAETMLHGRTLWNVNSTAVGGGVAELLTAALAQSGATGMDERWAVIEGNQDFFTLTKRLHHRLHGSAGDGGPLGPEEQEVYEQVTRDNARELVAQIKHGDVVVLHDPQTAGMASLVARAGAHVIWRAHIGADVENEHVRDAWGFLLPYLVDVEAFVFSRWSYVPPQLTDRDVTVIQPAIDIFVEKNVAMDDVDVAAVLVTSGIATGETDGAPVFVHQDWSIDVVSRTAAIEQDEPLPLEDPIVLQVSRWDPLKDMTGVLQGFADHVAPVIPGVRLVLAGPDPSSVSDDPEGAAVFAAVQAARAALDPDIRRRIHLVSLPATDRSESAAMVNALQRHATIIVQKSLAEGFGLTVSEGMWKARALVASGVGGIQDQIDDGVSGILLPDPTDLAAYGAALVDLLQDPDRLRKLGAAAHERVRTQFLTSRLLRQEFAVIERLLTGALEPR